MRAGSHGVDKVDQQLVLVHDAGCAGERVGTFCEPKDEHTIAKIIIYESLHRKLCARYIFALARSQQPPGQARARR